MLPFATGLGPLACLSLATLVAAGAVVLVERRRARREARPAGGPPPTRRPMGALTGAGIALGAVALLVYVIFVLRSA
ncbi:MAG TPA: hypothetical protein VL422_13360 [Miltoncostaea sp.]|nr:hypothetical protein [Miltoncostaea sp.]